MSTPIDPNTKPQLDRFKEAARALECDEDEAAFDEKLKGIAKQKGKDATSANALTKRPNANG